MGTSLDQQNSHDLMSLKEWTLKARISRESTMSRRYSALNLKSFREDATKSFRSNFTISSTASSPGYTLRDEIDPSTYSFTTALKALQAKTVYSWESIDGLTLNSKWDEAEKYICNPLSGEVPLECLSAKTLSGRSFRSLTSRITMSAPLIYPSNLQGHFLANTPVNELEINNNSSHVSSQDKKKGGTTRDVGIQSTPLDISLSFPKTTSSAEEKSVKFIIKEEDSVKKPACIGVLSSTTQTEVEVAEKKDPSTKKNGGNGGGGGGGEVKKICSCRCSKGCCLSSSLKGMWGKKKKTRNKTKDKPITTTFFSSTLLYIANGCTTTKENK